MLRQRRYLACAVMVLVVSCDCIFATSDSDGPTILGRWQVDRVWAGHPVGFYLLTVGNRQYVAYYDADRVMTVAARDLSHNNWTKVQLDSKVGWDSHNGIVMARDETGRLHVAGNMHVQPLVYFRTAEPDDVTTFQPMHRMVGREEDRCTYPRFILRPDGALIFFYRDGASGRGRQFFNVYDADPQTWRRLFDQPMWDGGEEMSAYPSGPILGPDGWWHVCWMWRDTPDCATNHTLCYAQSRDLEHWQTISGKAIFLPINPENQDVIVDGTPVGGGMINVGHQIGFDHKSRPIVTYHRYDEAGRSQIFAARWEEGGWKIRVLSNWDYRWDFGGGGSIVGEISAGPIRLAGSGLLQQEYHHGRYGSGIWILDEKTLAVRHVRRVTDDLPSVLRKVESPFPAMQVRVASDAGQASHGRYILRWETLPPNRDRPRDPPYPPLSRLEVILLEQHDGLPD